MKITIASGKATTEPKAKIKVSTSASGDVGAIVESIDKMFSAEVRNHGLPSVKDYTKIFEFRALCDKVDAILSNADLTRKMFVGSGGIVSSKGQKGDNTIWFKEPATAQKVIKSMNALGFSFMDNKSSKVTRKKKVGSVSVYCYSVNENGKIGIDFSIEAGFAFEH